MRSRVSGDQLAAGGTRRAMAQMMTQLKFTKTPEAGC
jgi:hypothetical protein